MIDPKRIWTIPNILSLSRVFLIPVIVWLYCFRHAYGSAAIVITISALTDIADGMIARKFNMITDVGKLLDPAADKLMQVAIVSCLSTRFASMKVLLVVQVAKELVILLLTYFSARKKHIHNAQWYGKLCSVVLFFVTVVHVLLPTLSQAVSWSLTVMVMGFSMLSLVMYIQLYRKLQNNR